MEQFPTKIYKKYVLRSAYNLNAVTLHNDLSDNSQSNRIVQVTSRKQPTRPCYGYSY